MFVCSAMASFVSGEDVVMDGREALSMRIPYMNVETLTLALNQEFLLNLDKNVKKRRLLQLLSEHTNNRITRRFYARLLLIQAMVCANPKTPSWFAYDLNADEQREAPRARTPAPHR